ncbi:5-bromo-4-chloroindolyl phosphate hydrolysis family protein [Roseovarius autotrophicus]|uniref:5-bromo-4-chloroindolyl phosphate hydrolysis family protein n=1 Tax=Roseovarius autotrophicus TaxID=2824121 RepID=UPI0019F62AF5|nr:5-bromo-4-chloroindolyl phosphate hydrolysis family protein [Roseovarius autotrophicus]MBE0453875.1 5-bromo-4-chloroindolyl phosphate hydrolysis family protein [Roseovarius sp.]
MAERFGGKFSPGGPSGNEPPRGGYRGARRTRAGGRVNMLFLAPLPLAVRAFGDGALGLALNLSALGLLLLAAWLTREGILAQEAYDARKIARRPAIPRKIFASLLTGTGLFVAAFAAQGGIAEAFIYAIAGAALHGFAFGLDPLRDKGAEGIDSFQSDRVARVVDQAEDYLKSMSDALRRAGDRQLERRLDGFQVTVRDMLRTVENDPRDLTAARRFLGVYLMGARDATVKYADLAARAPNPQARENYLALLADLERNFTAKTRALMASNSTDLDVEIEVLRDRLEREGIHLETRDLA